MNHLGSIVPMLVGIGFFRSKIPALLVLGFVFFTLQPATSAASDTPKETVSRLVTLFINWNGNNLDREFSNQAAQYIDYELMSCLVLGDDYWAKLSAAQRRDFITAFRKLVEQRYYLRWHRIFEHGKISYTGETNSSRQITVKTMITVNQEQDFVNWILYPAQGSYKVVSLTTDHRDLLEILRPRFHKVILQRGFDGFMVWLNHKATSSSH
jgi:ABC-type transporter MlaC component